MQYELCKARLEKISDGCMEFIHPQLIECLLCQQSFNLHQPFNMCRAIRHLKAKHPNLMPEYAGVSVSDDGVNEYGGRDEEGEYLYSDGATAATGTGYFAAEPGGGPAVAAGGKFRSDHTAAALPPSVGNLNAATLISTDGQPVYILVADAAQQQQIIQQVIAARGTVKTALE